MVPLDISGRAEWPCPFSRLIPIGIPADASGCGTLSTHSSGQSRNRRPLILECPTLAPRAHQSTDGKGRAGQVVSSTKIARPWPLLHPSRRVPGQQSDRPSDLLCPHAVVRTWWALASGGWWWSVVGSLGSRCIAVAVALEGRSLSAWLSPSTCPCLPHLAPSAGSAQSACFVPHVHVCAPGARNGLLFTGLLFGPGWERRPVHPHAILRLRSGWPPSPSEFRLCVRGRSWACARVAA